MKAAAPSVRRVRVDDGVAIGVEDEFAFDRAAAVCFAAYFFQGAGERWRLASRDKSRGFKLKREPDSIERLLCSASALHFAYLSGFSNIDLSRRPRELSADVKCYCKMGRAILPFN